MNAAPWLLAAALVASTTAVGCNGAASARATDDGKTTPVVAAATDSQPTAEPGEAQAADADLSAVLETTFDDLKFPMEKTDDFVDSMLTDAVRKRFDRSIRIRGYMFPTNRKRGLKQFVLVRDNMECCFGPGAALFDCVLVTMRGDATAEFSIRPIAVEGEFRFEPLVGPDGRPLAIYQMAGDAVK